MMSTSTQTLLQLSGAPLHPSPLADSALLLIDAQEEYRNGRLPLAGVDAAQAACATLLDLARSHAVPVFHIVHQGKAGGLFDPAGTGAILPAVQPRAGETIVHKTLPNSFARTELDIRIRATGRSELIIAGFMTHMCVSATARCALDLGYRSTVVAAATATRDLPDPLGGGKVAAADIQRIALAELADRFAVVVPDALAWR
ncbi:MAG TPA: cysteine hydrolase family protein [Dongiaceae bacterium]|nr:cysteine hydrolase family protein [Dongiaceae bacterium]